MSRRDREKQKVKQTNKQQHISVNVNTNQLPMLQQVFVVLPLKIDRTMINEALLKQYIKAKLIQKKKININDKLPLSIFGKQHLLSIYSYDPHSQKQNNQQKQMQDNQKQLKQNTVHIVGAKIQINFIDEKKQEQLHQKNEQFNSLNNFFGNTQQFNNLKQTVIQNFKMRQKLFQVSLGSIRGIIISGSTGSGKSTLIRRLNNQLLNQQVQIKNKIKFLSISATQLLSRVVGGAEQYVRNIFSTLSQSKYSVLVIQDMHLLFGQKQISSHQTVLATLFSEMDTYSKALIVIGTYNSQRSLSPIVFQSGRFEKQIVLNLPNHHQRLQIVKKMLSNLNIKQQISENDIKQFNLRINGFSIGQIKQVLRDAYILKQQMISKQYLIQVLKKYRPSQIKELIVQVPEVYWSSIGGYQAVKHQIRKVTELPLKFPQKFQALGIQPSKGVLLYGPPGCSKTMMAKAIATESKLNFISIKGPQLYSKYVGQSQRAIRNVFRKARAFSPCIIFFDEIDALATQRNDQNDVTNRLLGQLLTQMDGIQGLKQVIIIAATNRPQILDQALTRPGRFDHLIYIGPPDLQARKQIFKICLKKTPLKQTLDKISNEMAERTQNYTGAEINLICRQAALMALQQNIDNPVVSGSNFETAICKVKSRLSLSSITRYQNFRSKMSGNNNQQKSIISQFKNMSIGNNNPFKF